MTSNVQLWSLKKLKPHPEQAELIRPMPQAELRALAEKLERDGTAGDPIHVLPDGTIVDGHQRWMAAKLLGLKEIHVVVLRDLADRPGEVRRRILESNLLRKQADPVDRARMALALHGLDRGPSGLADVPTRELDTWLAGRLGCSLKHARRLRRIALDAPAEVQRATSEGRLPIELAEKVAMLDDAGAKAEIAAANAAGADPAEVVRPRVRRARTAPATDEVAAVRAAIALIEEGLSRLPARHDRAIEELGSSGVYDRLVEDVVEFAAALRPLHRKIQARHRRHSKDLYTM